MKVFTKPEEWLIKDNKLRQLNDKLEQKKKQYCYKPYRNLRNYLQ